MNQRGNRKQWRASLILASSGITLAFSVLIGVGLGYLIDRHYKTSWATPVFALLGTIAGFRELIRAVKLANQAMDEEEKRSAQQRDDERKE